MRVAGAARGFPTRRSCRCCRRPGRPGYWRYASTRRCAQAAILPRSYITKWNHDSKPFTWTATANEIITKARLIHRDFKKMLDSNDNSQ